MDYAALIAVWMVAITGPCVLCWLAGDCVGSARTLDLYGGDAEQTERDLGSGERTFAIKPWGLPDALDPIPFPSSVSSVASEPEPGNVAQPPSVSERALKTPAGASDRKSMSFEEQAALAEWRRKLRGALAQSQASFRISACDAHPNGSDLCLALSDPHSGSDSRKALSEYQDAVASLQRVNRTIASQPARVSGTYANRVELAERRATVVV